MTLIRRIVGKAKLQDLDAFSKVPDDFKKQTVTGGTFSLLSYILMTMLALNEIYEYSHSRVIFRYKVDSDIDSLLDINVDITIGTPCEAIGADVIDPTNQNNAYTYGQLIEEQVWFELTPQQSIHWNTIKDLNAYLRDEHYRLRDVLWHKNTRNNELFGRNIPPAEENVVRHSMPDSCRLHGVLTVKKVAGNLHVTSGKHIPLPIGHAHVSFILGPQAIYNFSHRIEKFSFGSYIPSIVNPLEGEEKIDLQGKKLYQYYIKVVSTDVKTDDINQKTFQYTVTETERDIDHDAGSHGTPGIHFRYDFDAIAVEVVEQEIPLSNLLVRLCGVIGGVYATSGFLSRMTSIFLDLITCKYLEQVRLGTDNGSQNSSFATKPGFHSFTATQMNTLTNT